MGDSEFFRDDYCRTWAAEDGSKQLTIWRDTTREILVTVTAADGTTLASERPTKWIPRTLDGEKPALGAHRLDKLVVELGDPGLGVTYDFYFAVESTDQDDGGGYQWRPVAASDPVGAVCLHPEGGASFWEAVLGPWDDRVEEEWEAVSWIEPLVPYRPTNRNNA